jgi:hypothetical protein
MSILRTPWTLAAASMMAAGLIFNFSGGASNAAQVIEIPESQQAAPADDGGAIKAAPVVRPVSEETPEVPKLEVAQLPPPPFYMGPTYPTQLALAVGERRCCPIADAPRSASAA